MRKLIILLLAINIFAACNNDKGNDRRDDRRSDRETDDYRDKDKDNKDMDKDKDNDSRDKWSAADVSTFNRECEKTLKGKDLTDDQKNEVCSCLLGKFQDKYSTYDELDRKGTEEEGKAAGEACMVGIGKSENTDKNSGGGWTRSDQQQWMDICDKSVGTKMGKEKKSEYCGCVLEQLEKRYTNYDVMNRTGTEQEGIDLGKECLRKMGIR